MTDRPPQEAASGLSRRRLLGLLAGAGVMVGGGAGIAAIAADRPGSTGDGGQPAEAVDEAGLVAVGRRCIDELPEGDDVEALVAALDSGGGAPVDDRAADRLEARLAETAGVIRADYADGRTISVDGWLLSLTEARLCALIALAP